MLESHYCQHQILFSLAAINKFLGWPSSISVSWLARQSVTQAVSWPATLLVYKGHHSGMEITITHVNCLTYPFSRSSSWSFWSRGNWLGLIINQVYSFTPLTIARSEICFSPYSCIILTYILNMPFWVPSDQDSCYPYLSNTMFRGSSPALLKPHVCLCPPRPPPPSAPSIFLSIKLKYMYVCLANLQQR